MQSGTGLGIDSAQPILVARPPGEYACSNAVSTIMENAHVPHHVGDVAPMRPSIIGMRSSKGMTGLRLAEVGGSMVEIDKHTSVHGSRFKEGVVIEPGSVTPIANGESLGCASTAVRTSRGLLHYGNRHRQGGSLNSGLSRQGTLLSVQASPERRAEELKRLLGNSTGKVKPGSVICTGRAQSAKSPNAVAFEQGKSRLQVSLDLVLENNVAVESGYLSGCTQVCVNPPKGYDSLNIGGGKIRVVGFEMSLSDEHRHIFYQIATPLANISSEYRKLFVSSLDSQGFGAVMKGSYSVPFCLRLPVIASGGKPRGVLSMKCGAIIRYISIVSMRIVDPLSGQRSIAHFYRECEIWPVLDIAKTLSPLTQPIEGHVAKKLFMGGDGSLSLSASLHRGIWIAGQPIHVRVRIVNETRKTVRSLGLAIMCTTTLFRPSKQAGDPTAFEGDPDACETETNERKVAEITLAAGDRGTKGHASAKGWWTCVGPGETVSLGQCMSIPAEALTIARARLLEVEYALRINLNVGTLAGTSDVVHVVLPIRIVSPISLDPPPFGPMLVVASSVNDLNTSKTPDYATEASKISRAVTPEMKRSEGISPVSTIKNGPVSLNLSINNTRPQTTGLPISSSAYANADMYIPMRPTEANCPELFTHAPIPSYPTTQMLEDFGGFESVEELDGALGDIPGSASMLEESDISPEFPHRSTRGSIDASFSGQADIGSDEEIEMMIDCASARIQGEDNFNQQFTPQGLCRSISNSRSSEGRNYLGKSEEEHGLPRSSNLARPHLISSYNQKQRRLGSRIVRPNDQPCLAANRRRLNTSLSPRRPTFSERVHLKKMQANQSTIAHPARCFQLREAPCSDAVDSLSSSDGEGQSDSPESIYTQTSATPCSQVSEDVLITKKPMLSHSSKIYMSELSSNTEDSIGPISPVMPSRIRSAPDRKPQERNSAHTTINIRPSKYMHGARTEAAISPVRRRIALLEEKTRQEIIDNRPSFTSRYTS